MTIHEHKVIPFLFHVQPFGGLLQQPQVLWLLLTPVRSACFHNLGYIRAFRTYLQGKYAIFLSIYILHLLSYAFGSKDLGLFSSLIQRTLALYDVRVSQTGDFPPASFRFHLTGTPLP